jgi:hypothetical protein
MAGFELTLYGRIWVTPKELKALEKRIDALDESIRDLRQVTRAAKSANAQRQSQTPR